MPKAYWIAHIDITDPGGYKAYVGASTAAVASYGGRHVVRAGMSKVVEGHLRARHIVVEFSNYAAAIECYESAEYQRALSIRQSNAKSDLVIVEGFDGHV